MSRLKEISALLVLGLFAALPALAQERSDLPEFLFDPTYYGTRTAEKNAVHDGNQVAITFYNYGLLGNTGQIRGEWPKGSENFYVGDVLPVIAMEVPVDLDGDAEPDTLVRHAVTTRGPRNGTNGPPGNESIFWGFEAKPGFASNQVVPRTGEINDKPAMSTSPETWPQFWPDNPDWVDPATGEPVWNGYFGRGVQNADLESFFWIDDQADRELYEEYGFQPDSLRPERYGQGLEVKVRGMQWSQFLAQDALFMLYEVTNSSTTTYPRVSVGLTVGTLSGGDGDSQDDLAFFDQANRIVYSWDYDDSGNRNQDVGYVGYGFLESPGDPNNGIDDDGDGDPTTEQGLDVDGVPYVSGAVAGSGNIFERPDFDPRTLEAGDPIILIDDETGERSIVYLDGEMTVTSQGRTYTVAPGDEIMEAEETIQGQLEDVVVTERNLIDEDLDGIIDEDVNLHFERRRQNFSGEIVTIPAVRYENYIGFAEAIRGREPTEADSLEHGLLNPMIDEARDDGIDNDGDWNASTDDVGADGIPGTGDEGEADGEPTAGEPNFDDLDVDESDQVGLSSFYYFTPPNQLRMDDDEGLWRAMAPGFFTTNNELEQQQAGGGVDGDFIFGSGYFRLPPGKTLRFSMALVFGEDLADITNNSITIQEIYDRNYNFARPPVRPNLNAVSGDGRVTLYWDSESLESIDPVLGQDFQGYKLYRSTDPFFRDPEEITDAFGTPAMKKPLAQFDLDDGVEGFWRPGGGNNLYDRVRGTPFYLGDNTGLKFSYVDTTVQNGRDYYYALTAYDSGSPEFYPAENNFSVSVAEDGSVVTGDNVVEVRPNAATAGYEQGGVNDEVDHVRGPATGDIFVEVLDPTQIDEAATYQIEFSAPNESPVANRYSVTRSDGRTLASTVSLDDAASTVFDGMRLAFRNDRIRIERDSTQWLGDANADSVFVADVNVPEWRYTGTVQPYDYEVRIADEVVATSLGGFRLGTRGPAAEATDTYFSVYNTTADRPSEFVFVEASGAADRNGRFDAAREFIFIYEMVDGEREPVVALRFEPDPVDNAPVAGDVLSVETRKPFSPSDEYAFGVEPSSVDQEAAKGQLEDVAVVPNPYVAAAAWEKPLPPTINSGRGERRVDFINLPADATIRIYNVRGELVRELYHDSPIDDGTVSWDLRTREDLEAAYGVYFYHVTAPDVGETTGKLALIK